MKWLSFFAGISLGAALALVAWVYLVSLSKTQRLKELALYWNADEKPSAEYELYLRQGPRPLLYMDALHLIDPRGGASEKSISELLGRPDEVRTKDDKGELWAYWKVGRRSADLRPQALELRFGPDRRLRAVSGVGLYETDTLAQPIDNRVTSDKWPRGE